MENGKLEEKIAIVTGAASGIGAATARLLGMEGAVVLCADLNAEGAAGTATAIAQAGGSASGGRLDVTDEAGWSALIEKVVAEHGRLDVLVNSAGISHACPLTEMSLSDWRRVMAVNLDGAFLGTKHAVRAMREIGTTGGSIVNVSSASGLRPAAGAVAYSVSKAAVCMLSRTAAKECKEAGLPIRVNTVCPAGVKTPMWTTMPFFQDLVAKTGSEDGAYQALADAAPGSRFAEPEEIAQAILYLASDDSRFVTGLDLVIDGGYIL